MIIKENGCLCGKVHKNPVDEIIVGKGVLSRLPEVMNKYKATKAFILSDKNTFKAAGEKVCGLLKDSGIDFTSYVLTQDVIEPDEKSVGSVFMHYDKTADIVIGVGSGVINDIGKIIANVSGNPYTIVATAPSMDGYASATSSMSMDGLKVSLPSKCANVIIGDIDILKNAPLHMLKAGIGDMLAKYISICEWRIAHLILGEYFCSDIAELVREALKKCTDNAEGLLKRDETAVAAVFEGLTLCGIAMAYAGVSRPASGVEHYFSHVWDMRGLEFGTNVELHGIQCALGTYLASGLYAQIKNVKPDKEKALGFVNSFSVEDWNEKLRDFFGNGAETMISQELKEGKYNVEKHAKRIDVIIEKWDEILEIINEEIPEVSDIEKLFETIDLPTDCYEIGIDRDILPMTFESTKDIRDKYVLSRLCWDLGIIEDMKI